MKYHYDKPTRLAKIKEDSTYQGLARVSSNEHRNIHSKQTMTR